MAEHVLAHIMPEYLDAADRACMMGVQRGIRDAMRTSIRRLKAYGGMHGAATLLHMLVACTPNVTALDWQGQDAAVVLGALDMASARSALADLSAATSREQAAAAAARLAAATDWAKDWDAGMTALGRLQELRLVCGMDVKSREQLARLLSLCTGLTRLELSSNAPLPPVAASWGAQLTCLLIRFDTSEPKLVQPKLVQLCLWLEQQKPPLVKLEIETHPNRCDSSPRLAAEALRVAIAAGQSGRLRELCMPHRMLTDGTVDDTDDDDDSDLLHLHGNAWLGELCRALHGYGCHMRQLHFRDSRLHFRDSKDWLWEPLDPVTLFQHTLQELCIPAPYEDYHGGHLSVLTALTSLSVFSCDEGTIGGVLADLQHLSGLRALRIRSRSTWLGGGTHVGPTGSTLLIDAVHSMPHLERLELYALWGIDLGALLGALRPDTLHTLELCRMVYAYVPDDDDDGDAPLPGMTFGADARRDAARNCGALGPSLARLTGLRKLDLREVVVTLDDLELHRAMTLALTDALPLLTKLVTFGAYTPVSVRCDDVLQDMDEWYSLWQDEARNITRTLATLLKDPRICPALTEVRFTRDGAFDTRPGVEMRW